MKVTMRSIEDAKKVATFVRTLEAYKLNVSRKGLTVEMHTGAQLPEVLDAQRKLRAYLGENHIWTDKFWDVPWNLNV